MSKKKSKHAQHFLAYPTENRSFCYILQARQREIHVHVSFKNSLKDVRSLRVNIDRALIFGYDLHEHLMQLFLKFGQYLQHSLFIT